MTAAQLKSGMHNIELAVMSNVRQQGGKIIEDSFVWNYGVASDSPPEIVVARITANARTACLVLPREYCEASADSVNRTAVWESIKNCLVCLNVKGLVKS